MAHIKKTCIVCGAVHKICFKIEEYNAWQSGTPIQTAFPDMEPDKRELLISGICGPCFDACCTDENDE